VHATTEAAAAAAAAAALSDVRLSNELEEARVLLDRCWRRWKMPFLIFEV